MSSAERKLFAIHLVGDALLLYLGYLWLGVGESSGLRLAWSALFALMILALACWLHGGTLAFFRVPDGGVRAAFAATLRQVPVLLVAAIVVLVLYGLLAMAAAASAQPAFRLASWLTLTLRIPVKPPMVARIFLGAFWIVRWVVLPVALVPLGSAIAAKGWKGFARVGWRAPRRYWVVVPVLLAAGLLLPLVLLRWVPGVNGFSLEMASFAGRMVVAYLLFAGCVWWLERVTPK
ncbi:MAG: hypothetical protein ABI759_26265 [Candidatus Solibacter sp.]